eukprot:CAMPEP_0172888368 /NCGR_PEP_ID=MMETSP1075-20121228/136191_1 /TAXON_ID=2916 /ORGANISM="Ceratium fusus, Strain PA161109" /LENGTH=184 /DNA_ID=CAMNT_0013742227 /DNA_START=194 /DNA_END=745 /DNA_ORIENTATION=-
MVFAGLYQQKHVALRVLINAGYGSVSEVPNNKACMNANTLTEITLRHVGGKHFIPCLASGAMQAGDKVYAVSIWPLIRGAKSLLTIGRELYQTSSKEAFIDQAIGDPGQVAQQLIETQCALASAHAAHNDLRSYNILWKKDNAKGHQLIIIDYDNLVFTDPDDFDPISDINSVNGIFRMLKQIS